MLLVLVNGKHLLEIDVASQVVRNREILELGLPFQLSVQVVVSACREGEVVVKYSLLEKYLVQQH